MKSIEGIRAANREPAPAMAESLMDRLAYELAEFVRYVKDQAAPETIVPEGHFREAAEALAEHKKVKANDSPATLEQALAVIERLKADRDWLRLYTHHESTSNPSRIADVFADRDLANELLRTTHNMLVTTAGAMSDLAGAAGEHLGIDSKPTSSSLHDFALWLSPCGRASDPPSHELIGEKARQLLGMNDAEPVTHGVTTEGSALCGIDTGEAIDVGHYVATLKVWADPEITEHPCPECAIAFQKARDGFSQAVRGIGGVSPESTLPTAAAEPVTHCVKRNQKTLCGSTVDDVIERDFVAVMSVWADDAETHNRCPACVMAVIAQTGEIARELEAKVARRASDG